MSTPVKKDKIRGKGVRFEKGHAPLTNSGNPYWKIISQIRAQIYACATPVERMEIFRAIVEKAKQGSLAHAEYLTDKWIGKVAQPVEMSANVTLTSEEVAKRVDDLLGLSRMASIAPSKN